MVSKRSGILVKEAGLCFHGCFRECVCQGSASSENYLDLTVESFHFLVFICFLTVIYFSYIFFTLCKLKFEYVYISISVSRFLVISS